MSIAKLFRVLKRLTLLASAALVCRHSQTGVLQSPVAEINGSLKKYHKTNQTMMIMSDWILSPASDCWFFHLFFLYFMRMAKKLFSAFKLVHFSVPCYFRWSVCCLFIKMQQFIVMFCCWGRKIFMNAAWNNSVFVALNSVSRNGWHLYIICNKFIVVGPTIKQKKWAEYQPFIVVSSNQKIEWEIMKRTFVGHEMVL